MIPYCTYTPDGRITAHGVCATGQAHLQAGPREQARAIEASDLLHYLDLSDPDNPVRMDKRPFAETLNIAGQVVTLSGLPAPCTVVVDRTRYEVDDGEIEIEFALPGKYRIRLEHPHYLTKTLEINL